MKTALIDQYCDSPQMPSFPAGKNLGEEGLYYFNARWYDPNLGRFITEDPIKDGTNWFAYVSNNPLRFVDPTGLVEVESDKVTNAATYDPETNAIREPEPEAPMESAFLDGIDQYNEKMGELSDKVDLETIVDVTSMVSGLIENNPEVVKGISAIADKADDILAKSEVVSSRTGQIAIAIDTKHLVDNIIEGDTAGVVKSGVDVAVGIATKSNPVLGATYSALDVTYGTAIKATAETAANINQSYENDPVGFMASLYEMFGASTQNMWAPRR